LQWCLDFVDNPDQVMDSVMTADDDVESPTITAVAPVEALASEALDAPSEDVVRPGAYGMRGFCTQDRRDDPGTIAATTEPTTVAPPSLPPPLAAEVVSEDPPAQEDIDAHIRRVLADSAVPADSVIAFEHLSHASTHADVESF